MSFLLDDISMQTAQQVCTAVCRWRPQASADSDVIHCISGVDASGQLIVFEQSSDGLWKAINLSTMLNRLISQVQPVHARVGCSHLEPADTHDDKQARNEVLILPDDQGHLVIFHCPQGARWQLLDISAECSVSIERTCRPVVWEQQQGAEDSLHLLAVGAGGALLEFVLMAGQRWRCLPVGHHCAPASLSSSSSLFAGAARDGNARLDSSKMAFSINRDGLLYRHLRPSPDHAAWQHETIVPKETQRLRPHSTVAFVVEGVCHVAACDVFGSVLVYRQPINDTGSVHWHRVDVTAQTGCRARAVGSAMLLHARAETNSESCPETSPGTGPEAGAAADEPTTADSSPAGVILTAYGNGRAYRFWWNAREQWQVTNLEEAAGLGTRVSAHAGLTETQDESLALVTDNRLVLCHGLETIRHLSRRLVASGQRRASPDFARHRHCLSRVVAWQDGSGQAPELRAVGEAVFGSRTMQRNVASYLDYASGGAFTLQRDDVIGWFDVSDTGLSAAESSGDQIRQRFQQAIHSEPSTDWPEAAVSIGQENSLEVGTDSRLMIVAHHGDCPATSETIERVLWSLNGSISVIRLIQEILLICTRLPRLPRAARHYDLMALDPDSVQDGQFLHPNGAWKLLLGWVRPRLAIRPMRYQLKAVADSREVIVIVGEAAHSVEYFVIENRQCRPMDDVSNPGLLVWHVLNRCSTPNSHTPTLDAGSQWTVTLASVITEDATSSDPLFWAEGSASGYTLRNVTPSADIMSFDLVANSLVKCTHLSS